MRVLITRERSRSLDLIRMLEDCGASVYVLPAIQIVPTDPSGLDNRLAKLSSYDLTIFTSMNAVEVVMDRLVDLGGDPASAFTGVPVAAVGGATGASLSQYRVTPDILPAHSTASGLLEELEGRVEGLKVFLPGSRIARPELRSGLEALGAQVDFVPVYDTVMPSNPPEEPIRALRNGYVDVVVFASPSAVRNFVSMVGRAALDRPRVVAIGPTTAREVERLGLVIAAISGEPSAQGLIAAIIEARESNKRGMLNES